jgi:RND family efflux transporter MFP subunit
VSRRWRRFAIVAAALVVVATATLLARPRGAGPRTAKVTRGDFRVLVEATGKLEAAVAYEIGPPSVRDVWNYTLQWLVPDGTRVKAGDVVARFDATEQEERLRDLQAQLQTTSEEREKERRNLEIAVKQLQLDVVKAEGDVEKLGVELALPDGMLSNIDLEQKRLDKALAQKRLDFLRRKVDFERALVRSKLELLDLKIKLAEQKIAATTEARDRFSVRAPVDGIVLAMPKRNGDRWEVGEDVWMLAKLLKVADVSTLRVEADVLEVDAARIAAGQRAEVTVDAMPGVVVPAKVSEVGRLVRERSPQDRTKVFDAILAFEGERVPEGLRPGMSIHAVVEEQRIGSALSVPIEAIRASGSSPHVEVVDADGGVSKREVVLGPRNHERVVVTTGVKEGESVLVGAAGAEA